MGTEPASFEPPIEEAKAVTGLLIALMAVDLIAAVSGFLELRLLIEIDAGVIPSTDVIVSSDRRQRVIELFHFALFITTAIFWIRWFRKSYANLSVRAIGGRRFPVWQATWAWFVPVLNLYRPKQLTDDIWRATDLEKRIPFWVHAWWAAAVTSAVAGVVGTGVVRAGEEVRDILIGSWVSTAGDLIGVVSVLLAVTLVRRITERQNAWQ